MCSTRRLWDLLGTGEHPGGTEKACDADVKLSWVICVKKTYPYKMWCICSPSVQAVGWGQRAGPRDSLADVLATLVGLLFPLNNASGKALVSWGGLQHLWPPARWGFGSPGLISTQAPHRFVRLAVGLNILPYMSHILKYSLDMGLGCCHNILNQIRVVMLTSVTRQRLACSAHFLSFFSQVWKG